MSWGWIIAGIIYLLLAYLGYALCKAAGDADDSAGYPRQ